MNYSVLGLMSGSSLDGLDIAYCTFEVENDAFFSVKNWEIKVAATLAYSKDWQERLANLTQADALTFARTDVAYSRYAGDLVNQFLEKNKVEPDFIAAHGHTIFHFPSEYFTTQIGEGAALAAVTGYPVICDFRTQDVANGGQGAPIASIADKYLLSEYDFCLNLGGIANITSNINGKYIAFDISGANQTLNEIVAEIGLEYDDNGNLAAKGKLIEELFDASNQLPFLQQKYPKTLDNQWVRSELTPIFKDKKFALNDRLRTACEHTAYQVAESVHQIIASENLIKDAYRLLVTGGGGYNGFLMDCIKKRLDPSLNIQLNLPNDTIIGFKEAAMIALMGVMRLNNVPNCMSSVTGAVRDTINGAIYQGWKKQI